MVCKNKCINEIYPTRGINIYELGYEYCRACNVYIKYDKIFCYCCGKKLRVGKVNKNGM